MEPSSEPLLINALSLKTILNDQFITSENIIIFPILCFLLVGSALVSGSEIAFFSFKAHDLDEFKDSKNIKEQKIASLISEPSYLLATILIANNFFNIAIIILSSYLLNNIFNFSNIELEWLRNTLDFGINVILVTFLIVLFGEVIPKVYATQKGIQLSLFMVQPLTFTKKLFQPLSTILIKTTDSIEGKIKQKEKQISADEVDLAIDITTQGTTTKEEVQILKNIVRFGEINVTDVMTSRPDIQAVNSTLSFHQLIKEIKQKGFSRVPVYQDSLDTIIGVLYAKDLLAHLDKKDNFFWPTLAREPYFVPENKKIDNLLDEFQKNRSHIAFIVDEYGGTAGLITLEDILEEIVGEIADEFDDISERVQYEQINEHTFIFEGKASLFDICKIIKEDFHQFDDIKGEADSLAGLLLETFGVIPKKNQKIKIERFLFTVLDVDHKRIKKIKIERNPKI